MVHENNPTLGTQPFNCRTKADFTGKVLDANGKPVKDAIIHYMPYHFENRNHVDSIIPRCPVIKTND